MPAISKRAQAQRDRFGHQGPEEDSTIDPTYFPSTLNLAAYQIEDETDAEDDLDDPFIQPEGSDLSDDLDDEDSDSIQSFYGNDEEGCTKSLLDPAEEGAFRDDHIISHTEDKTGHVVSSDHIIIVLSSTDPDPHNPQQAPSRSIPSPSPSSSPEADSPRKYYKGSMAADKRPRQTKHSLKKTAMKAVGKGPTLFGYFGGGEDPLFRDSRKRKSYMVEAVNKGVSGGNPPPRLAVDVCTEGFRTNQGYFERSSIAR